MIFFLLVIGALSFSLSFFAPSAPVEPPPDPPPIVETVETRASGAVSGSKLESIAGLGIVCGCGYVGFRLARAGQKRERKRYVKTSDLNYFLLMKRLNTMASVLEAATDATKDDE